MSLLKKNPLAPASLATGGAKGAEAEVQDPCQAQDTAQAMAVHALARMAVQFARAQLDAYATTTDEPHPGTVDAADLLDAVDRSLALAFTYVKRGGAGSGE